jgi:hypothetical protein
MNLYQNGFVVAELNSENGFYNAWPLQDLSDDKVAASLTQEANDNWFDVFDVQEIVPDASYTKIYCDYCSTINLDVKILLFESLGDTIVIDKEDYELEICEVLGFDCIGTVYYSYLQNEITEFLIDLQKNGIALNKHGLFDRLEDAQYYFELRQKDIASGIDLEYFWGEMPVRISIVNILQENCQ